MNLDPAALGRRFGDVRMAWLLGAWLAATTAIALNRGISLLWGMVWLLVAAMAVAWIFPRLQLRDIVVRRSLPTEATAGEPIEIRYEIDSGLWPRYGLELLDQVGDTHELALAAYVDHTRGVAALRLRWVPPVRGRRVFGDIVLQSGFPLGLSERRYSVSTPAQELIVYPSAVPLRRLPIEGGADAQVEHAAARMRGGRDDYLGSRAYRPGDEPRTVNWRGTARNNELVVREYDRSLERQFWIFLELSLDEHRLPGRDGTLELMFSIAHSALLRAQGDGVATGLVCRDRGTLVIVPPGLDRMSTARIREVLARVEGERGLPLSAWMTRERQQLPRGGTWLMFAGDVAQRRALATCSRESNAVPLVVQFERDSFHAEVDASGRGASGAHYVDGAWVAPAYRGMDLRGLF
jgi:uncharacterized protein (DUF58 family)